MWQERPPSARRAAVQAPEAAAACRCCCFGECPLATAPPLLLPLPLPPPRQPQGTKAAAAPHRSGGATAAAAAPRGSARRRRPSRRALPRPRMQPLLLLLPPPPRVRVLLPRAGACHRPGRCEGMSRFFCETHHAEAFLNSGACVQAHGAYVSPAPADRNAHAYTCPNPTHHAQQLELAALEAQRRGVVPRLRRHCVEQLLLRRRRQQQRRRHRCRRCDTTAAASRARPHVFVSLKALLQHHLVDAILRVPKKAGER